MHGVSIGIEFSLSVLVGLGAGYWLDKKLGTAPWLMFVGIGFGFTAGLRSLLQYSRRSARAEERDAKRLEDEERQKRSAPPSKPDAGAPTDPDV
jgi:ATP synthase protein I